MMNVVPTHVCVLLLLAVVFAGCTGEGSVDTVTVPPLTQGTFVEYTVLGDGAHGGMTSICSGWATAVGSGFPSTEGVPITITVNAAAPMVGPTGASTLASAIDYHASGDNGTVLLARDYMHATGGKLAGIRCANSSTGLESPIPIRVAAWDYGWEDALAATLYAGQVLQEGSFEATTWVGPYGGQNRTQHMRWSVEINGDQATLTQVLWGSLRQDAREARESSLRLVLDQTCPYPLHLLIKEHDKVISEWRRESCILGSGPAITISGPSPAFHDVNPLIKTVNVSTWITRQGALPGSDFQLSTAWQAIQDSVPYLQRCVFGCQPFAMQYSMRASSSDPVIPQWTVALWDGTAEHFLLAEQVGGDVAVTVGRETMMSPTNPHHGPMAVMIDVADVYDAVATISNGAPYTIAFHGQPASALKFAPDDEEVYFLTMAAGERDMRMSSVYAVAGSLLVWSSYYGGRMSSWNGVDDLNIR